MAQRVQVVRQLAVRMGDQTGPPAEHRVTRQDRPIRRKVEREAVRGVAGGADHADLQAVDGERVPVGQAFVAEPLGRIEGAHRCAGQFAEAAGRLGVVRVAVRQQDQPDPGTRPGDLVEHRRQVSLVQGTGIDHDGPRRRRARPAPRCWSRPRSSGTGSAPAPGPRARSPGRRRRTPRRRTRRRRPARPARSVRHLDDEFDLDRCVQRQHRDADGASARARPPRRRPRRAVRWRR